MDSVEEEAVPFDSLSPLPHLSISRRTVRFRVRTVRAIETFCWINIQINIKGRLKEIEGIEIAP